MTRIGAGLSIDPETAAAARTAAREAQSKVVGDVDLAFLFFSSAHLPHAEEAAASVREELAPRHLLGCAAQGVLARNHEVEDGPAVAVWAASLPGATIETFHAAAVETEGGVAIAGFPALHEPDLVALLVDPYSFPAGGLLERLNEDVPGVPLVGGIAIGGPSPGAAALVRGDEIHSNGAVGAVLADVPVRTIVSQGCAPIGHDAVVTRAEGNVVYELAGKPAIERLTEEISTATEETRALAAQGLLAGLVIDENLPEYGRGDYLMRGLLGGDEESGALAVGESVRVGQTLRFHVRDADSADADLRDALASGVGSARPAGALLFTCNGRGTNMFPTPDHDARVVAEALGSDAVAGFFCGGEIGPVGGRAFLHGFTATMAVFLDG